MMDSKKQECCTCLRCGNCCTRFGVCVTPFDIERITQATGLAPMDFLDLLPEIEDREREEPWVLINGSRFLIVLKRKPNERCKFYSGNGCLMYEIRPMLCKTYPFILRNNKFTDVKSRACVECWHPKSKEKKGYLSNLKQYKKEVSEYKKIAGKWNEKGGGSFEEFLEFMHQQHVTHQRRFTTRKCL